MSVSKVFILREERNAQALWAFLKANWKELAKVGKPLQITIGPEQTQRSIQQNKRYWAILRIISETGWIHGKQFESEAWHWYFRKKFIGMIDSPDGDGVPMSTTKLSVEEFAEYMTQVEAFAATELGVEFVEMAA